MGNNLYILMVLFEIQVEEFFCENVTFVCSNKKYNGR